MAERNKEFRERSERLGVITKNLTNLQQKAIREGLDMEERSLASKYEHELGGWLEEDPIKWFNAGGVMEYTVAEQLRNDAKALRKGGIFGTPVI